MPIRSHEIYHHVNESPRFEERPEQEPHIYHIRDQQIVQTFRPRHSLLQDTYGTLCNLMILSILFCAPLLEHLPQEVLILKLFYQGDDNK